MTPERIVNYLKVILEKEAISFEEPGLWLLGKAAEGSMRDALSLTDQSISFGDGKINEGDVASMLGTVDRGRVFGLATALAQADAAQTMALIAQMAEHAVDFNNLLADLLGLIHRIAIAQAVPDAVDNSQGDKEQVMILASAMSPAMVQLLYQVALTGKRDLPLAPDPRAGMEMTLLRMLNFAPIGSVADNVPPATGAAPAKKPDLALNKRQSQPAEGETESLQSAQGENKPENRPESHNGAAPTISPVQGQQQQTPPLNVAQQSAPAIQGSVPVTDTPILNPIEAMQARAQAAPAKPAAPVQANDPPPWDPEPMGEVQYIEACVAPVQNIAPQPVMSPQPQGNQSQGVQAQAIQQPVVAQPQASQLQVPSVLTDKPVSRLNDGADTKPAQSVQAPAVQPKQALAAEQAPEVAELLDMELSSVSWPLIFAALPVEGMLRNLVANTCLMQIQGDNLIFHSDAGHMRLFGDNHQQKFNQILNQTLSRSYKVQVIEGPWQYETPAQRMQRLVAERQQQAINSIENDPNVQALRQAFDAQVIMESITPVDA